jgi:diguanylate cyclase (GGDEF)-like protein
MITSRPLLLISLFIVLSDILFIIVNYYSALTSFESDIGQWAAEQRRIFDLVLQEKSTTMQQIATYVANDHAVQQIFLQGKTATEHLDSSADTLRRDLYNLVSPSWEKMTSRYDVRQLHFHLGPGSTSFLRVHRPEKFGDNMDAIRYTVVDANRLQKPTKGFETGRVYSGIRGVVPISAANTAGVEVHIGALEAGTSFSAMLNLLHDELESHIAILLSRKHVTENMWPEFINNHYKDTDRIDDLFIESASMDKAHQFLGQSQVIDLLRSSPGERLIFGKGTQQVCTFSLRDYRGQLDTTLPDAGVVVIWKDASDKWQLFRRSMITNIIYALFALVIIESILVLVWRYSQSKLHAIISTQTAALEKLAALDGLTGVLNRRTIESLLANEMERSSRYDKNLAIMLFDLDFFKQINDTYGHNVGDKVLQEVTSLVGQYIRRTDYLGRWGGEEFLVIAPETHLNSALDLAKRICASVAAYAFPDAGRVTISVGITRYRQNESREDLLERVDSAMYRAKKGGRNRVEVMT